MKRRAFSSGKRKAPVLAPALPAIPGAGIGLDIIEIDRVAELGKRNPRFLTRVFSRQEIEYCRSKKKLWQHFAARFAAKEAVWKAIGSDAIALRDISVSREPDGRPGVLLKGRPARDIQLSLSHSNEYALAIALRLPGGAARKGSR